MAKKMKKTLTKKSKNYVTKEGVRAGLFGGKSKTNSLSMQRTKAKLAAAKKRKAGVSKMKKKTIKKVK